MVKKKSTARKRAKTEPDETFLQIDEHRLEKEWCEQAPLFHKYALLLAEARRKYDELKNELSVTAAELDNAIRADPDSFDIPKVTETGIKNAILQQDIYQKLIEQQIAAQHEVNVLDAMVRALEQRRSALKCLVELRISDYYAEPTLSRDNNAAYEEMTKREVRSRGRR